MTTTAAIEALLQAAEWQEPENLRRYLFPAFSALAAECDAARQERDEICAVRREAEKCFGAQEEVDEAWAAIGTRGNRNHLSLSEQLSSLFREEDARAEKAEAELTALRKEVERMRGLADRKKFPILGERGVSVDWQLVADHGGQANTNHGQTVARLAERGGLSWCELFAVLHNRRWEKMDANDAMIACRALETRYLASVTSKGGEG